MNITDILPQKWLFLGVVVAAAFTAGLVFGGRAVYKEQLEAAGRKAAEDIKFVTKTVVKQGEVTTRVLTRYLPAKEKIVFVTKEIEKEVIKYVPRDVDVVLPRGWRLLHDAYAIGALPQAPEGTDVSAPDIVASAAVQAVGANYGTCRAVALQLTELQAWVRGQYEVLNLTPLEY